MNTEITNINGRIIIKLQGKLDTPSTPDVEAAVMPLMNDATIRDIMIDCSELSYISSSGLRIFITLQKHSIKNGGTLTLSNLTPTVQSVFEMTGFSNIFTIV